MSKRLIRKHNKTAKQLLEKLKQNLQFGKLDRFDAEDNAPTGTWVVWSKTSWEYEEWEFTTAYYWLHELLYWEYMEADWSKDGCGIKFTPDLSTSKKVFDLAKNLIARGGVA